MTEQEAPLVYETPGGLCVRYRGRPLYSERDPSRLPRRVAGACDRGPARLHLVFSPLLWYGLSELLENMDPGSAVLCVEADPALARLAREAMPREIEESDRIAFIASASPEEVLAAARAMGNFRAASAMALSGGEALNAGLYARISAIISSDISARWRNRASLMVMGRLWARNIFANLAALPSLGLGNLPRLTRPAVVCGAGPSLEEALPFIVARRSELAVVACDTALGSLLAAGIVPDLLVCLEAQAHNLADFTPLGSTELRTIADLSSHPATFRAVRGTKYLSFVAFTESPFLARLGLELDRMGIPYAALPPLGSVGVHALHLARRLSPGPIFAAGLDFSFEPGKTHARGTPSLLSEERKLSRTRRWNVQYEISFRERNVQAPCQPLPDGRRLLSDPVLLSYAELLADEAARYHDEAGARGDSGMDATGALYDIRGRGPSIGAAPLGLTEATALLDAAQAGRRGPAAAGPGEAASRISAKGGLGGPHAGPSPEKTDLAEGLDRFLGSELETLIRLRDSMKGHSRMEADRFAAMLEGADYLYWSFPDADRVRQLPQDFLNRLLPEIDYWSWRIESSRATLAEEQT